MEELAAAGEPAELEHLVGRIQAYNPQADAQLIRRAYEYSARMHAEQKRESGEPYVTHPLNVALIIAQLKLDLPSIVTGLLHDVIEDTVASLDEVRDLFGPEVATLVDGVTKVSKITFSSRAEKQAENFRKMVIAMAHDIRVVLIKLADRLHNMRTLSHLARDRQEEIGHADEGGALFPSKEDAQGIEDSPVGAVMEGLAVNHEPVHVEEDGREHAASGADR